MAKFKTLKDLLNSKILTDAIEDSLAEEVADIVCDIQLEHIQTDVYNAYSPVIYSRRGDEGGLGDRSNIDVLVSDKELVIENNTSKDERYGINPTDKSLTEIIVTGDGYMFTGKGDGAYLQPRDFIGNTKEDLRQNKQHIKAMKKGLKRNGMNVK